MKTKPGDFTRGMIVDKIVDTERLSSKLRALVEDMDLLKLEKIHVSSSGSIDDGLKLAQRFINSANTGITNARTEGVALDPNPGPESPKPAPKRRKKQA